MIDKCSLCRKWNECKGWFGWNNQTAPTDNTIIDEWESVSIPPAPELTSVVINPESTALLILDMETRLCKNPRCLASITKINHLMNKARQNGMLIVYSLTPTGNPSDIFIELAPKPGNPIVRSSVDKFYKTNLSRILQQHGIKTALVTGYAANGAVLHTATSGAFHGVKVVVPVDGMSASNPYAEQYTAWHMLNSPGTRNQATLTKISLIKIRLTTNY